MIYRTQVRIIADVLTATRGFYGEDGTGITTIIQKANLSYNRLTKVLNDLVTAGLLCETSAGKISKYKLSEKGEEFLNVYGKFEEVADSFGLRL